MQVSIANSSSEAEKKLKAGAKYALYPQPNNREGIHMLVKAQDAEDPHVDGIVFTRTGHFPRTFILTAEAAQKLKSLATAG